MEDLKNWHPDPDELTAHYFEGEVSSPVSSHLKACTVCRAEFESLKADMAAIQSWQVPDPGPQYEARTWEKLRRREPSLNQGATGWWKGLFTPGRLTLAGALASLLVVTFYAGRFTGRPEHAVSTAAVVTPDIRERLLAAALGEHLEESERVLIEIVNGRETSLGFERERAEGLLNANRLYRQTAERQGQKALTAVLEDLERVLLEVAHSSPQTSADERLKLRTRVDDQALLFKIRVMETRLRAKENQPAGNSETTGTRGSEAI